jgi:hypothetical protein
MHQQTCVPSHLARRCVYWIATYCVQSKQHARDVAQHLIQDVFHDALVFTGCPCRCVVRRVEWRCCWSTPVPHPSSWTACSCRSTHSSRSHTPQHQQQQQGQGRGLPVMAVMAAARTQPPHSSSSSSGVCLSCLLLAASPSGSCSAMCQARQAM